MELKLPVSLAERCAISSRPRRWRYFRCRRRRMRATSTASCRPGTAAVDCAVRDAPALRSHWRRSDCSTVS